MAPVLPRPVRRAARHRRQGQDDESRGETSKSVAHRLDLRDAWSGAGVGQEHRPRSRRSVCSRRARMDTCWPPSSERLMRTSAVWTGATVRVRRRPRSRSARIRPGSRGRVRRGDEERPARSWPGRAWWSRCSHRPRPRVRRARSRRKCSEGEVRVHPGRAHVRGRRQELREHSTSPAGPGPCLGIGVVGRILGEIREHARRIRARHVLPGGAYCGGSDVFPDGRGPRTAGRAGRSSRVAQQGRARRPVAVVLAPRYSERIAVRVRRSVSRQRERVRSGMVN